MLLTGSPKPTMFSNNQPMIIQSGSANPTMMNTLPQEISFASPTKTPTKTPTKSPVTMQSITFTTKRDGYDILQYFDPNPSEIYKYVFLADYTGVVEPYADMWMSITSTTTDDIIYKYEICEESSTKPCTYGFSHNTTFLFECTPLVTKYAVTMNEYNAITKKMTGKTSTGQLLCMYVRREFRALTDADLGKTMEAMWKLWEFDDEDGQKIYGESFHSYAYLLNFHYFNAAWIHSDHVHEGNGFAAQHFKMSNIFEKSMQTVEPSITLPYWDFTIETAYNIAVWDSPLFTSETFGSLPLPNNYTW